MGWTRAHHVASGDRQGVRRTFIRVSSLEVSKWGFFEPGGKVDETMGRQSVRTATKRGRGGLFVLPSFLTEVVGSEGWIRTKMKNSVADCSIARKR